MPPPCCVGSVPVQPAFPDAQQTLPLSSPPTCAALRNADEPPNITDGPFFALPAGDAAVGWGFIEYYTDHEKWFRMAVHEYNSSKAEAYRVGVMLGSHCSLSCPAGSSGVNPLDVNGARCRPSALHSCHAARRLSLWGWVC